MAPPAGHVDDHGSFENAARCELFEEVGISASRIELIAEGFRENRCRRPRGYWHYWKIYRAHTAGHVQPSKHEVVSHRWCDKDELNYLAAKTVSHLKRQSSDFEMKTDPGLEEVWLYWFAQIGLLENLVIPDRGRA